MFEIEVEQIRIHAASIHHRRKRVPADNPATIFNFSVSWPFFSSLINSLRRDHAYSFLNVFFMPDSSI